MLGFRGAGRGGRVAILAAAAWMGCAAPAFAQAEDPGYFRVIELKTDDNVNVRSEPNANAKIVGKIPKNTDGVKNLGCKGGLTPKQLEKASAARKKENARTGWCQVEYNEVKGWVSRRLLAEGSGPKEESLESAEADEKEKPAEPQKAETPPPPPAKIEPSFDCEKAAKHAEKLICEDSALAALDREVARLYRLASEETNATPGFEELLDGQRRWLAERNTCFDAECLAEMHVRRVHRLRHDYPAARQPGNASRSAGPYVLRCDGLDAAVGVSVVTAAPGYAHIAWRQSYAVMKKMPAASGVRYEGNFARLHAKGAKALLKLPAGDSELNCKLETGG